MSDSFECDKCGEEFDSERGLHIHIGQIHEEEEKDTQNEEDENNSQTDNESSDEDRLQIPIRMALIGVFVLGVAVGLSSGLLISGSSLDLGMAESINGDGTDNANPSGADNSGSQDDSSTVDVSTIEKSSEPVLGESDAPVTMVIYEDFQCPFCKRFETGAVQQVESEYVESGQVKLMWKDFPLPQLGHDWAEPAAETMECVYRQDEDVFWNVKDTIFQNQETVTRSTAQDQIIGWASSEGVSESAVRSCIQNENPMEEVNADKQEGQGFDTVVQTQRGPSPFVSGTPSSVIYAEGDSEGTPIVGAQSFSTVQQAIDSKLN